MLVKICGITDAITAAESAKLGADYIGILLSKLSARAVSLDRAKEIADAAREHGAEPVGVFADEGIEEILKIIQTLSLKVVQLHGDRPRAALDQLPQDLQIIYVVDQNPLPKRLDPNRDLLLYERIAPNPGPFRFFIAGGLDAESVRGVIDTLKPHGVDVSSGVEKSLAVKDIGKIAAFVQRAKPGRYGSFGGSYVPELLSQPLKQLTDAFETIAKSTSFQEALIKYLKDFVGRPTALTEVPNFAKAIGVHRLFLKREDLAHTGAHKINNSIGQSLLAKKMGKTRIIAETGAGQHGVATAAACALLGLECVVYMGTIDIERQTPNVARMRLLGATVIPVEGTLKDSVNAALRDWAESYDHTHYCLGSALGPHPFPAMVAEFQSIIGKEAKEQLRKEIGRDPDLCIACIGGGSNAIGLFSAYLKEKGVELLGVEAGGKSAKLGEHAARFQGGSPGVLHGSYTYVLQTENRQIAETHSISAGLDYPAIGPQHAALFEQGRVRYDSASDEEALSAFKLLCSTEGIIPALESSHALGCLMRIAPHLQKDAVVLVNLSGRGDKDIPSLMEGGHL